MFAAGTYERVAEEYVIPSLRALGDAWAAGRVAVAGEHVASNAVLRRLAASFQASGPGRDGGRPVLVGMPPGARHELGGLIFATSLRRNGIPVIYLGADLPLDDWIAAMERTDARAVVIGAVMPADTLGGTVGRRRSPRGTSRGHHRVRRDRRARSGCLDGTLRHDDPPAG